MSIFAELGVRDGKDRVKEEVIYNLAACYTLAERRIAKVLAPHNLSPVKLNVLLMVRHVGKNGGISQTEISKRMIVTAGNITRLIDRMEKEALVQRVEQPGDRRVKLLKITNKGTDLLEQVWPIYKKEVEKIVSVIPNMDIVLTGVALNTLRENLCREMEGEK